MHAKNRYILSTCFSESRHVIQLPKSEKAQTIRAQALYAYMDFQFLSIVSPLGNIELTFVFVKSFFIFTFS